MQEHPYFSRAQIFFGKPSLKEEVEDEQYLIENPCTFFFGDIGPKSDEKIGMFLFLEQPKTEEDIYFS